MRIDLVTLVVADYDPAIAFFTGILGFELVEDEPSLTNDGRPKRWVVVRPPGAQTGILLARADGERQEATVGDQVGRPGRLLPPGGRFRHRPQAVGRRRAWSS